MKTWWTRCQQREDLVNPIVDVIIAGDDVIRFRPWIPSFWSIIHGLHSGVLFFLFRVNLVSILPLENTTDCFALPSQCTDCLPPLYGWISASTFWISCTDYHNLWISCDLLPLSVWFVELLCSAVACCHCVSVFLGDFYFLWLSCVAGYCWVGLNFYLIAGSFEL